MSMILAPYNDAMRIGQGFNSYTHELCIDGAVAVQSGDNAQNDQAKTVNDPAQVVSYSARVVEKLSDVVESMNVSYCSSIKRGTVAVSGSSSTIDETTFKSADINIVVTVKVTNQTTIIKESAEFRSIDDIKPGTQAFDEAYGDSYISGFIKGGEFTGIISLNIIDRTRIESTMKAIKSGLDSKDQAAAELTLNTHGSGSFKELSVALSNTESHIGVSWMGGGQVKNEETRWDVESVFAAAAAFPKRVAECPQRTWAILTKYKSNRSYVLWSSKQKFAKTLEYDQISSYTAELFDSYMDYKMLLKELQTIMDDRNGFEPRGGVKDALDTSMDTLLCVRSALREEQSKIITAIDLLSKDPGALRRQGHRSTVHRSTKVANIISRAMGISASDMPQTTTTPASTQSNSDSEGVIVLNDAGSVDRQIFSFASLLPAEVWKDVMPVAKPIYKPSATAPSVGSQVPVSLGGFIQAFPSDSKVQVTQSYEAMKKDLEQQRAEVNTLRAECEAKVAEAMINVQKAEASRQQLNQDLTNELEKKQKLASDAENARVSAEQQLATIKETFQSKMTQSEEMTQKMNSDKLKIETTVGELMRQLIPGEREPLQIFYINYAGTSICPPTTFYERFYKLHDAAPPGKLWVFSPGHFSGMKMEFGMPNNALVTFVFRLGRTGAVKVLSTFEGNSFRFY